MIAIYRYLLASLMHRQTYLPPVILFGVAVAVGSRGDGGPLLPLYGLWTGAMLISSAWLTMVVLGAEEVVQERITMVNSRRRWLPLVAAILVVLTFLALMTGWGLVFPVLVGVSPAGLTGFVVAGVSLALLLVRGLAPVNLLIRLLAAGRAPDSIVGEVLVVAVGTFAVLAGSFPVLHRLRREQGNR